MRRPPDAFAVRASGSAVCFPAICDLPSPVSHAPGSPVRDRWPHAEGLLPLNHGSFGACPTEVLERQCEHRDRMERDGVSFFVRHAWGLIDEARARIAPLMGAEPDDLAFVSNASAGVATVLANLERSGAFRPGDEVLANDHEYGACLVQIRDLAARRGLVVRTARLPFPTPGLDEAALADAATEAVLREVTDRTRLCLLSLVTSPSALRLPAGRIVAALRERGVETVLDAAHGIGFVPFDAAAIGAAFTVTNAHKWLCSPKGCALLHVRRDVREGFERSHGGFRPLVLSVHAERPAPRATGRADGSQRPRLHLEFDYAGAQDVTPWLAAGDAAEILPRIWDDLRAAEGGGPGWAGLMERNRALALRGQQLLCDALGTPPPAPPGALGAMAVAVLPDQPPEVLDRLAREPTDFADPLQDRLLDAHGIQVPIWRWERPGGPPLRFVRISAHLYNGEGEYERLARLLPEELARERSPEARSDGAYARARIRVR